MLPRVCIPSYNRPELLKSKTLNFLKKSDYPSDLISIFIASSDEMEKYSQICPGYQLVVGVPGLKPQRKFISDWLSEDEIYLGMDDDIDGVKTMGKSFLDLIRDACKLIGSRRSGLWGILPKDDGRCFKDDTSEHLSFIIGCLFVCRNHKDIVLEGYCLVDDYERTMLYFLRYGIVYRYRGAGVQTKYRGTSGDPSKKGEAVLDLIQRFPGMCRYRDKKGEPDLLLNWRFKI